MLQTQVRLQDVLKGQGPVTLEESASVAQAAELMLKTNKGAVLVTREHRLTGIFTERDLVRRVVAAGRDPRHTLLSEVMTFKLVTAHPQDSHVLALQRMVKANCRHLPVVEGSRVVGMVSRRQLMALDIEIMEQELDRHDPSGLFI